MKLLIFFICISVSLSEITITVKTKIGQIKGHLEKVEIDGNVQLISKFYGIPYAESTSGYNRFRKPFPKAPFKLKFDARAVPNACFQQTSVEMDILRNKYGVPGFSEDCLTLNIYSPYRLNTKYKLPVMVWFHGGGFRQGAASMYNPEALAIFAQVVVVTVNYRVGMFGFLRDRDGFLPGNQGLWDQHLALKWINGNIKSFHGNRNNVTIFGQSAGGAMALLHGMYPGNKGLFSRVIAESGSPLAPWSVKDMGSFEKYMVKTGCLHTTNSTLECMQSKDPMLLLDNSANLGPVVDGEFLTGFPEEILFGNLSVHARAREFFSSLDVLIGFNDMDGVLYYNTWASLLGQKNLDFDITKPEFDRIIVPEFVKKKFRPEFTNVTRKSLMELLIFFYTDWNDPKNFLSIRNCIVAMTNDPMFYIPAIQVAKGHAQFKRGSTYLYEFAVQTSIHPLSVPYWLSGSYHADEIPFVFGFPLLSNTTIFGQNLANYSLEEQQTARTTMSFWSNFAKSGNPNFPKNATQLNGVIWPEYTTRSQSYLQISNFLSYDSVMSMEQFHPRRMAFWSKLVPNLIDLIQ